MFTGIKNHTDIGWVIVELTAEFISENMLRAAPVSLNAISYNAVITALETIRDCDKNHPPIINHIYIDTVGDPATYEARLVSALGRDFATFTIEKKADATYKVVGAASIIAKVTRDTVISQWVYREPCLRGLLVNDFGSGYPGDERCVEWLDKACKSSSVFAFPSMVRFSWSTAVEFQKKMSCAQVTWECDEEDGGAVNITGFFSAVGDKRPRRSAYFEKYKVRHVLSDELSGLM